MLFTFRCLAQLNMCECFTKSPTRIHLHHGSPSCTRTWKEEHGIKYWSPVSLHVQAKRPRIDRTWNQTKDWKTPNVGHTIKSYRPNSDIDKSAQHLSAVNASAESISCPRPAELISWVAKNNQQSQHASQVAMGSNNRGGGWTPRVCFNHMAEEGWWWLDGTRDSRRKEGSEGDYWSDFTTEQCHDDKR